MNLLDYDIFLVEIDVGLEHGDSYSTGYHIEFVDGNGVEWNGEIMKHSDEYWVTWFNGGCSPKNWGSIDGLVNTNFNTIQKIAYNKNLM